MESGLLQAINLATLIATKAARVVWAAEQRRVAEFAFRRAQNPFVVARSSYIGGCASTSFLAAAFDYRLLATGTVPHALIQLFPTEEEAFTAVAESFNRYTLLLDTYDPRQAIHTAIAVAQRAQRDLGHTLAAVRLDSGDLVADSQYVRAELAKAGMGSVRILASGDLDEFAIADLLAAGAEIDSFGVGTSLGVGAGSVEHGVSGGALGGVYKEVFYVDEDGGAHPKLKLAGAKTTWPGRKEIYRHPEWHEDVIQLEDEPAPEGLHTAAASGDAPGDARAGQPAAAGRGLGACPGESARPAGAVSRPEGCASLSRALRRGRADLARPGRPRGVG